MKRIATTFALIIATTSFLFAGNPTKEKNEVTKPAIVLSAEEVALELQLTDELSVSVESVLAELQAVDQVSEVKVFDLAGNEVASQKGKIDFTLLPANASLLMTEGNVQYYVLTK